MDGGLGEEILFEIMASIRKKELIKRVYLLVFISVLLFTLLMLTLHGIILLLGLIILGVPMIIIGMFLRKGIARYDNCELHLGVTKVAIFFPTLFNPGIRKSYELKSLYSVEERKGRSKGYVMLGFKEGGHFIVLESWFLENIDFRDFISLMKDSLTEGESNKEELETREVLTKSYQQIPIATFSIASLLVLFFIIEKFHFVKGYEVFEFLRLGGLNDYLFLEGEYYRLSSAVFLHVDSIHLFSNMFVLIVFGNLVEPIIKKSRFSIIFLISGLCASLLSIFLSNFIVSIGASGAIYGITGAYIFIRLFLKDYLPANLRISRPWILYSLLVLNMGYGYFSPTLDFYTHLGGLFSGFFLMLLFFIWERKEVINLKRSRVSVNIILAFCIVIYSVSLISGYRKISSYNSHDYRVMLISKIIDDRKFNSIVDSDDAGQYFWLLEYIATYFIEEESTDIELMKKVRSRLQVLGHKEGGGLDGILNRISRRIEELKSSSN